MSNNNNGLYHIQKANIDKSNFNYILNIFLLYRKTP